MNKQKIFFSIYNSTMNIFGGHGLQKLPFTRRFKQYLISQAKSEVAEINGNMMFLGSKDSLCLSINGIYEKLETNFIKENIKEGDIVLDIGANIGYYTLLTAKIVGESGKIFAFEPEPNNFAILTKNVKINQYQNVILNNAAVSDKSGTVNLYLSKDRAGMHRIYPSHFCSDDYIPTNLICLDEYFKTNPIWKKISFVKIDVEGSELGVLNGMKNILSNSPLIILLEFVPACLKEFGSEPTDIIKLLQSYDFKFFYTDEDAQEIKPITNMKFILEKFDGNKLEKLPKGTNLICIK